MISRRKFMGATATAAAAVGFPTIIPSSVLGADAPSNTIQVGQIGFGRIGKTMDVPGIIKCKGVKYVAIADLDKVRIKAGLDYMNAYYAKQKTSVDVKGYQDYNEIIARKDIDAVAISTPDHWHSQPAVEASFSGKDVYMQKPASLTIAEGRFFSDALTMNKGVFLLGSQQRSSNQFHRACELVRNGAIGKVKHIEIGLPGDPAGGKIEEMPVPEALDYKMWLGSTPEVYYTQDRVHNPKGISGRPGWLRCEQFGAGMITGWGSHHLDIAHWAMGWERQGPKFIEGKGQFHTKGLWDVHGDYDITMTYANGTTMRIWNKFPNGVRFIGEDGRWIFVSRGGAKMTASDPISPGRKLKALDASKPEILKFEIPESGIHLYRHRGNHHQNWVDCIRSRKESLVPAETAHRSCSACLVAHIGMKLGRKLEWDYKTEKFVNNDEANSMLSRTERAPYGTRRAFERLSN
ncbi:MAG: Gfo/Idh/MocA family oxidoreductase [Kiritimatiellae bacterium]|jgi:predicted dehydrogenase|nr:Gfo/Idh/MocA family oxidoreductase [Kiritimatiellia bacterium]